jgi:nucleotide-binding universal stress UspA family protein
LLVPLDRTETSATVLVYVIELALAINGRVVLVTVLPGGADAAGLKEAERYLTAIARGLEFRGVAHDTRVAVGDAATEIAAAAAAERCELIVMTPHARAGGPPSLLGGTADRVVRSSAVPVMLVRPEHVQATLSHWTSPPPFIVGLDGSALAATAVGYAAGFARRLGSELVLVRAIEPALPLGGAASYYQSPSDIAMNYLREVADSLRPPGLRVSCEVLLGPAEREIVRAAAERPSAVVALCTRGYSGRKDWVLGSITDAVVRSIGCPVLVIPPAAAA